MILCSAASLDLCLHVVQRDYGTEIASWLARDLVVPLHRDGGQAQFIETPLPASPTSTRAIGSDPGVIEVNMKGARVRICANAPSGVIAATLKALRP